MRTPSLASTLPLVLPSSISIGQFLFPLCTVYSLICSHLSPFGDDILNDAPLLIILSYIDEYVIIYSVLVCRYLFFYFCVDSSVRHRSQKDALRADLGSLLRTCAWIP